MTNVARLNRIARNSTKIGTGIGVRTRNSRRSNINSRLSSRLSSNLSSAHSKAMASAGNLANAAKAGTTNAVASSNSAGAVVDLI